MKIVPIEEIPTITQNTPLLDISELYSIAQKMESLCIENNGIGLAAVQVGIPWKFFVYYNEKLNRFNYMIDCEYTPLSKNNHISIEGCLSIKDSNQKTRLFKVMRHNSILVKGKKLVENSGQLEIKDFEKTLNKGLECVVFQHEIDHQNNILISSIGEELITKD